MFSNKRNMNFNFFTVSSFNQRWMSGYYKMMKQHLREWKHQEVDLVVLKLTFCFRKLEGNIDESVNYPHNRNSQQKEMGKWISRYFWEMLNFKFLALFTVHLLIFSIFPYFLQGTYSKRNCAVLHTTLQIKDESDFAND